MNGSDDFGNPISAKELRSVFVVLSGAVLLLLLFGVALAVRLQSSAEALREGMPPSAVAVGPGPASATDGETTAATTTDPSSAGLLAEDLSAETTSQDSTGAVTTELSNARAVLPTPDSADAIRYGVRVGIFEVPENADRILVRLQAEGYAPFVVLRTSRGRTLRYVYALAAETQAAADDLAGELTSALGLETYVEAVEPTR